MNYCPVPFRNISIHDAAIVQVSPCSYIAPAPLIAADPGKNPNIIKIQQDFENNRRPKECVQCWNKEHSGGESKRTLSLDQGRVVPTFTSKIKSIDLWTGNTCNLQCITCGPDASSAWQKELGIISKESLYSNRNKLWDELNLADIETIHFSGGEPILNKNHVDLLNKVPNKKLINLQYHANGTILPQQYLIDLWAEFEAVHICFSLDAMHSEFEYIRYPGNWEKVLANIQWFRENCHANTSFSIFTTISILNILHYPAFVDHMAANPVTSSFITGWQWAHGEFDTLIVPDKLLYEIKNVYRDRFPDIVNAISSVGYNNLAGAVALLTEMDKRRGVDYRKVLPHLIEFES